MAYYLSRLSPPRPSFLADMTPDEQALMRAHQEYWRAYVEVGRVAAIGAVADPAGAWGVAIIEAEFGRRGRMRCRRAIPFLSPGAASPTRTS